MLYSIPCDIWLYHIACCDNCCSIHRISVCSFALSILLLCVHHFLVPHVAVQFFTCLSQTWLFVSSCIHHYAAHGYLLHVLACMILHSFAAHGFMCLLVCFFILLPHMASCFMCLLVCFFIIWPHMAFRFMCLLVCFFISSFFGRTWLFASCAC